MNREKLQKELASRSGGFFLSVVQNAYKKLKPASKAPSSIREVAATDCSMLQYLERFGIAQYALSFIIDCAVHEDWDGVMEHAALMAMGLEQAAQDVPAGTLGSTPAIPTWRRLGGRRLLEAFAHRNGQRWHWRTPEKWTSLPTGVWRWRRKASLRSHQPCQQFLFQRGRGSFQRQEVEETLKRSSKEKKASSCARGWWSQWSSMFACVEEGFIRRPCSMFRWSGVLLRHLLRGRTCFSYFVKLCLDCSGPRDEASSALFPIPLPLGDVWSGRCEKLGTSRRRRVGERRILWLIVAALDFAECGSDFLSPKLVWRCPGPHHHNVYDRLIALVRACGPGEDFSVLSCGRKSFQLDARFEELREALQSLGLDGSSFYGRQRSEVEVPVRNDSPELQPYTALVPDRLKIVGEGKWDCRDYLSDLEDLPCRTWSGPRVGFGKDIQQQEE